MKFIDSSGVEFACPVSFTGAVDMSTATAISGQEVYLTLHAGLYQAAVYRVCSPVAGTITKIWSVLASEALTGGNATLTGRIGSTAITDGVITVTQVGSAVGDIDSATPTANNVVAAGSDINFFSGGTNTAEGAEATLTIVIRRTA